MAPRWLSIPRGSLRAHAHKSESRAKILRVRRSFQGDGTQAIVESVPQQAARRGADKVAELKLPQIFAAAQILKCRQRRAAHDGDAGELEWI